MTRYFKVVKGCHVGDENRMYKAGDIVESNSDLAKVFKGKFQEVTGQAPIIPAAARPVESTPVGQGSVNPAKGPAPTQDPTHAVPPKVPARPNMDPATVKPKGINVTKSFPKAVDEDFRVFRRGLLYFVYDADAMDKPLNSDGLKKDEVEEFIGKALEG